MKCSLFWKDCTTRGSFCFMNPQFQRMHYETIKGSSEILSWIEQRDITLFTFSMKCLMLHKLALLIFALCYLCEFLNLSFESCFNFWNHSVFIAAHHGPKLYLTWTHLFLLYPLCLDLPPYLDEKLSYSLCFLSPLCCILWACSILFILVLRCKVLSKWIKNNLMLYLTWFLCLLY